MKAFLILGWIDFFENPQVAFIEEISKVVQCASEEGAGELGEHYIGNNVFASYLVLPTYKGAIECDMLPLPADFNMLPEAEKMMRFENALIDYQSSVILPAKR